jgi:hypothetical protein
MPNHDALQPGDSGWRAFRQSLGPNHNSQSLFFQTSNNSTVKHSRFNYLNAGEQIREKCHITAHGPRAFASGIFPHSKLDRMDYYRSGGLQDVTVNIILVAIHSCSHLEAATTHSARASQVSFPTGRFLNFKTVVLLLLKKGASLLF